MVGRDPLVFALYGMTYCFPVQIYQNSFARLLTCTGLYSILCWCCRQSPQNFNNFFWWNSLVYPPPPPINTSLKLLGVARMSQWNSSVNIQDRENNKKGLNYEVYETKVEQQKQNKVENMLPLTSDVLAAVSFHHINLLFQRWEFSV